MKDELDELAAELARMRPSQPGQHLKQRIARNLDRKVRVVPVRFHGVGWSWRRWMSLAAAAAIVVVGVIIVARQPKLARLAGDVSGPAKGPELAHDSGPVGDAGLDLVRNANYLIEAEDRGLVEVPTPVPLRKVTWQYVSAAEFRDRRDNAVVQVFVPREETVLIPAVVH
ncbi:MAG TPA: hypothetical protein PLW35_01375 [Verrucomicrobiota bacterium]|nr:hypothetical protein [Verrucomicrobiota bacterium]